MCILHSLVFKIFTIQINPILNFIIYYTWNFYHITYYYNITQFIPYLHASSSSSISHDAPPFMDELHLNPRLSSFSQIGPYHSRRRLRQSTDLLKTRFFSFNPYQFLKNFDKSLPVLTHFYQFLLRYQLLIAIFFISLATFRQIFEISARIGLALASYDLTQLICIGFDILVGPMGQGREIRQKEGRGIRDHSF